MTDKSDFTPPSIANIDSKTRIEEMTQAVSEFTVLDTFIGLMLTLSILTIFAQTPWIDLGKLELASGGSYGDLLDEQKALLADIFPYDMEVFERIDLGFSQLDLTVISNNTETSPAEVIFAYQSEYIAELEEAGYSIPVEEIKIEADEIPLAISIFGFVALMLIGIGIFFASHPFGMVFDSSIANLVVNGLGRKFSYVVVLIFLTAMILSIALWLFMYMGTTIEALLLNQQIAVQPYETMELLSWGFWANLALLLLFSVLSAFRIFGGASEQNLQKAKN